MELSCRFMQYLSDSVMADVTGMPTQLVIRKEDGTEWTCKQKFVPHDDEVDED